MLFVFEGSNACGKTALIKELQIQLIKQGIDCVIGKAPDYTGLHGDLITKYLGGNLEMSNKDIDVLFKENRLFIQEEFIVPMLKQNKIILLDRFSLSAKTYSVLRDINVNNQYLQWLVEGEIIPHKTFLLQVDVPILLQRIMSRNTTQIYYNEDSLNNIQNIFNQHIDQDNTIIIKNDINIQDSIERCLRIIIQNIEDIQ